MECKGQPWIRVRLQLRSYGGFRVSGARLPTCAIAMRVSDEQDFCDFWNAWKNNNLTVYRGMSTSHWNWTELAGGRLVSEGTNDIPSWTMMGLGTSWLPTTPDRGMARGIGYNMVDPMCIKLSSTCPVPVGLTVEIPVGLGTQRQICWTNPGEYAVRGPLLIGDYTHDVVVWLGEKDNLMSYIPDWATHQLPKVRPSNPSDVLLMEWCREWHETVYRSAPDLLPYQS